MILNDRELVIIGGGPAGMAAAVAADSAGIKDILLIERENQIGGILKQCIHNGFGLHNLRKDFTGPEYADYYKNKIRKCNIEVLSDCMVTDLDEARLLTISSSSGIKKIAAKAIILATGCRERTAGAVKLSGSRPAGVFTAGLAQYLMNIQNLMVGKKVIIRGSGDIGLIMARRMYLEGANIIGVIERKQYSSGLQRNIVQCLNDYDIPIYYRYIVKEVHGKNRVEAVSIVQVDEKSKHIPGTTIKIACDTLILALGLIPENELAQEAGIELDSITGGAIVDSFYQTSVDGIFACGNALHVHDLVDYVSEEGEEAGKSAALFIQGNYRLKSEWVRIKKGEGLQYILPQKVNKYSDTICKFRVTKPFEDISFVISDENGKHIKKYYFQRVYPAEMLKIKILKAMMADTNVISINIEHKK